MWGAVKICQLRKAQFNTRIEPIVTSALSEYKATYGQRCVTLREAYTSAA